MKNIGDNSSANWTDNARIYRTRKTIIRIEAHELVI